MNTSVERKLTAAARAALEADDATRLRLLRQRPFIEHPTVEAIHAFCQNALADYPTEGDTHLLVVGDSGMGKSRLLGKWAERHGCDQATARPDIHLHPWPPFGVAPTSISRPCWCSP